MRRSDLPSGPSAMICCLICSFKRCSRRRRVLALTPELTSWFSGVSLAGFEVTLYGRFWVNPRGSELAVFANLILQLPNDSPRSFRGLHSSVSKPVIGQLAACLPEALYQSQRSLSLQIVLDHERRPT